MSKYEVFCSRLSDTHTWGGDGLLWDMPYFYMTLFPEMRWEWITMKRVTYNELFTSVNVFSTMILNSSLSFTLVELVNLELHSSKIGACGLILIVFRVFFIYLRFIATVSTRAANYFSGICSLELGSDSRKGSGILRCFSWFS